MNNEFLVVWEDHYWGWGNSRDIFGLRFKADGGLATPKRIFFPPSDGFIVDSRKKDTKLRFNPTVAYNVEHDEYYILYEGMFDENDVIKIMGRYYAADGSYIGPEEMTGDHRSGSGNISDVDEGFAALDIAVDGRAVNVFVDNRYSDDHDVLLRVFTDPYDAYGYLAYWYGNSFANHDRRTKRLGKLVHRWTTTFNEGPEACDNGCRKRDSQVGDCVAWNYTYNGEDHNPTCELLSSVYSTKTSWNGVSGIIK
jgi:hypothetical protein